MTDEKIKEEFEKWLKGITTQEEADFANSFNPDYQDLAQGYIAGSRSAERLAKIEVLEEVRNHFMKNTFSGMDSFIYLGTMIDELKAGQ